MLTRIGSYPIEREVRARRHGRGGRRFLAAELAQRQTLGLSISVNWRAGAEK